MEFLTIPQAAARLGLTYQRVDQFLREGRLPYIRLGRDRLVTATDLEAFQRRQRRPGRPRKVPV